MPDRKMSLIDKEYFIGAMEESKRIHGEYSVSINNFINSLKFAPTIDAEPVKHGRNESGCGFLCSVCSFGDFGLFRDYRPKFCPNCGAKMDGKENNND